MEIRHLVEELRVYQTELEIQNQELISAQSEISLALEKYRTLFDYLPLPAIVVDDHGFIAESNQQACELLGLSSIAALQHRSALLLFDMESRSQLHKVLRNRANLAPQVIELLDLKVGHDQTIPCDVHIIHLREEFQYDGRTLLVLVDRSAEKALRESESRFQVMADSAPVLIWIAGTDKLCYYFNQVWLDFTGRTLEQEMGNGWAEGVHPDDFQRCLDTYVTAFDARQKFVMEYRLRHCGGEYRWLVDNGVPRYDDQGAFLGYIGSCIDITDRKNADSERDRLLQIIEEAPDFVSMSDMQGHLKYLNTAGAKMVGLPDDAVTESLEIKDMHPEWAVRRIFEEGVSTVLKQGFWQGETALLHRDGHEIPVSQMLLLHRDESGDPEYLSTIMRDISQRKNFEDEITNAKEAAEAANIAKTRFLATMSHEIRTPMNGILGMAQMLLTPKLKDSERQDYARTVLNSGQTLLTLLNDILDLSKVEAGKIKLEFTAFESRQVIHETQSLYAQFAGRKGLKITTDWSGPPNQRYMGDTHRLRQMLSNLISNAIKFTTQGSIRIEATEVQRNGLTATLEFAVTDTGIGIHADKRSFLFQPFSQADSSTTRQFGGTGLGLSIVRAMARLMGGEVGVDSEVGRGSRFWFRIRADLVATDANSRQVERFERDESSPAGALAQFSGRIFAIEDDPTNRKVILALLSRLGLTVTFAENGQLGLEAITQGAPVDLILMDLQMPVMDGYETTRRIRQWEHESGQARHPIVALTADAFEEDRQQCLAAGMDDFIAKPIASMDALMMVLRRWLPAGAEFPCAKPSLLPTAKPVDVPRIVAILRELEPLLAQDKFSAVGRFKELQEAVAGTEIANEIAGLEWLVEDLHFGQVLERLHQIAAAQGWEICTS
jgi:PAS domain S-box-containing protein